MKIIRNKKISVLVICVLLLTSLLLTCGNTENNATLQNNIENNVTEQNLPANEQEAVDEEVASEVKVELESGDIINEALEQLPVLEDRQTGLVYLKNGTYEYQTGIVPIGWTLEGESLEGVIITSAIEQNFTNKGSIRNITFQNISGKSNGGAIYNDGGLVENCIIRNGYADADGGGIYNIKGSVINCTFESLQGGYFGELGEEHPSIEGSGG